MGTVYEAIQEKPRRSVAIKVMKRGIASEEALRRFEFESQLLARLKHPGIAEVYEAGTYDDGDGPVPYFAMEYVPDATPITSFAKAKKWSVRERLALFARVCDAVQHGHQKGIVHRDLKPDNIIVSTDGRPKIIDFGVARATDSDLALATLQTEVGQLVGTLQYMSPEQVSADPQNVDIRSDVYSLGVILYELLAETLPYELSGLSAVEGARRVQEDEPSNLSTIARGVAGDLATITHKALEKDRERRYQSAGELAADVRRYLDDQPIAARPPTVGYQLRVFARRNKVLVGSAAVLLVVLVAAVVTSTTLYLHAEEARSRSERAAKRSLAAIGFTRDVLRSARPAYMKQDFRVADMLSAMSDHLEKVFPDDPEVDAALRTSIALSYQDLVKNNPGTNQEEYLDAAQKHLERALSLRGKALGEEAPETVESLLNLADLLVSRKDLSGAERLERTAWETLRRTRGEEDPETIDAMLRLANTLGERGQTPEAVRMAREGEDLTKRALGEEDERTKDSKRQLARLLRENGDTAESERIVRELMRERGPLSEADRRSDSLVRDLAAALVAQGRSGEAAELYGEWRVPGTFDAASWFQGAGNPADGRPTLLFFFHEFCPYCYTAAPGMQEMYREFGGAGLDMIGVRLDWWDAPEDGTRKFIDKMGLRFPIAAAGKDLAGFYGCSGIPYLALVVDGNVVWRGHPDRFGDEIVAGALRGGKA